MLCTIKNTVLWFQFVSETHASTTENFAPTTYKSSRGVKMPQKIVDMFSEDLLLVLKAQRGEGEVVTEEKAVTIEVAKCLENVSICLKCFFGTVFWNVSF